MMINSNNKRKANQKNKGNGFLMMIIIKVMIIRAEKQKFNKKGLCMNQLDESTGISSCSSRDIILGFIFKLLLVMEKCFVVITYCTYLPCPIHDLSVRL